MAKRRFENSKTAKSFAKAVNGQVNDCRNNQNSKSAWTVTYNQTSKTKAFNVNGNSNDEIHEADHYMSFEDINGHDVM
jgi:hypothetical protein